MVGAITAGLFLGAPAIVLLMVRHIALARALGPIVLCYALGLLIGLTGLLPDSGTAIHTSVTEASLALALPLLLFSVDFRAWRHVAGRAMVSMLFAVISVVTLATALYYLFAARGISQAEQLSGMAVGMYTGGIANLGAIKLALNIPDGRYLLFATVDTAIGALYLLFVLTLAPRLFGRFLPRFPDAFRGDVTTEMAREHYADLLFLRSLPGVLSALLAAGACVGLAVLLASMLHFAEPQIMVIVLLTTFGLLASFIPPIRDNVHAPRLGMYLIYVFSICVAASLNLSALTDMDPMILVFIVIATFGSLALHAILCRVARVDADTFLITSVAAIMSPAFVPMVARNLRNPAILISGMATGILGFAIGNYLGISVALLLAAKG
ncbi:DUF819 family protein [Sedimentitalea nanhaiensis]|uniref:Uncharacterized membrane protein n=1 Tax=Sedimentitalea nanhaiensis TaxID=999627 RepID=A0A1I7C5K0_9RHOB|nr:DUF819 family protein [Sedimentitalea nanhaiensis]SFT94696.1 Uncharacterized membrane protein [Sedimentitalea nanhaiensis]